MFMKKLVNFLFPLFALSFFIVSQNYGMEEKEKEKIDEIQQITDSVNSLHINNGNNPSATQSSTQPQNTSAPLLTLPETSSTDYVDTENTPKHFMPKIIFEGNFDQVFFSPYQNCIAIAMQSNLKILEFTTGECLEEWSFGEGLVKSVVFCSDGNCFAAISRYNKIEIWNLTNNECFYSAEQDYTILKAILSPNANYLATQNCENETTIWDLKNKKCLGVFEIDEEAITPIAFSPSEKYIVTQSGTLFECWNIKKDNSSFNQRVFKFHAKDFDCSAAFSPNENYFIFSCNHCTGLLDLKNKTFSDRFKDLPTRITATAFSSDEKYFAFTDHSFVTGNYILRIFDFKSLDCLCVINHVCSDPIDSLAISPKKDYVISVSDKKISVHSLTFDK
jgi:WD40 repeat protein